MLLKTFFSAETRSTREKISKEFHGSRKFSPLILLRRAGHVVFMDGTTIFTEKNL